MNTSDEQLREIIANQAGEWLVAQQAGALDAAERRAFYNWLTISPVHIEEYLGIAALARHLPTAADDAEAPLEAILAQVRADNGAVARFEPGSRVGSAPSRTRSRRRWLMVAVPAALAAIGLSVFWWQRGYVATDRYATRHGELRSWQLSDQSLLRLNTDSSVTARYGRLERRVELERGEALFEVAHEVRPFRVVAGTASALAVGTVFSVRRDAGSTRITVVQGRVAVSSTEVHAATVSVAAGEQIQVADGEPPGQVTAADVKGNTAWLHRQIVFERQPLELVAAEFNRYTALPINIESPALRARLITGIFSVDDTDTFLKFLRTFPGVTVQATATGIRVYEVAPPSTASRPGHPQS